MTREANEVQGLSFFGFWNLIYRHFVGSLGREVGQSQGLHLYMRTRPQTKCRHTHMPRLGFDPNVRALVEDSTHLRERGH
jgi:hypothetical protein